MITAAIIFHGADGVMNSRNTVFLSQSNLPGMWVCMSTVAPCRMMLHGRDWFTFFGFFFFARQAKNSFYKEKCVEQIMITVYLHKN